MIAQAQPTAPGRDGPVNGSLPAGAHGPAGALILLIGCAVAAAIGGSTPSIAWLVVLVVPGLAASPFLPVAARRSSASALVASLVASACFWTISVPLLDMLGIGIRVGSLFAITGLFVAACLAAAWRNGATAIPAGTEVGDWAGLGVALAAATWIATRTFHDPPLGSDWGHYWRFADAIVGTGSLDAINTGWMGGGLPFGDYPGLPSLLAAWLAPAGLTASATPALAGILYCACVASTWLAVRSCWGSSAAGIAGVASALLPPAITTIGWSGLALSLSLVFAVPLTATVSGLQFVGGAERRRLQLSTAALATATLATQPLTAIVFGAALGTYSLACLVRTKAAGLRALAGTAGLTVALAVPVLADYRSRLGRLGVSQDYRAFLPTRISWAETLTNGLLPALAVALALTGLVVAASSGRTRRLALVALLLIGSSVAYSQGWRVELTGEYRRAAYLLAPALAIGFGGLAALGGGLRPSIRLAAAVILLGGLAFTVREWPQRLDDYYLTVTPSAASAAAAVGKLAANRGEAIVTDSCWSFPTLGLTKAKVYAALEPSLIGPRSEAIPAAKARAILAGSPAAERLASELDARWLLLNPRCPVGGEPSGTTRSLPRGFVPVASSRTLLIGYRPSP